MTYAIIGGVLIGFAVSIMLLFNGRVTGISGILGGVISPRRGDILWRLFFILGLVFGGFLIRLFHPESFIQLTPYNVSDYVIAGVLVGIGTLLGNGCTSGHGVCGISRMSTRSLVATGTFIFFGVLSVLLYKWLRGGV